MLQLDTGLRRITMETAAKVDRRTFLSGCAAAVCSFERSGLAMHESAHRHLAILDAPSNLGLKPPSPGKEPGVRNMPGALRAHGIVQRLRAEDAGIVVPAAYAGAIDPAIKVRNAKEIRDYSLHLADRIGELLGQGRFPLVLGGDCSILLGSAFALRKRGRYGLLFVDGHSDLLTPASSQTGGAAGMDLALATGVGPELLTDIEGKKPYIRPEDTILFGYRRPAPDDKSPAGPQQPMAAFSLSSIRQQGIAQSARTAVAHLESAPTKGFWIHVDMDVLATEWMSAVDSPEPGGMTPHELSTVLKAAVNSECCIGMEFTIYDPTLDPSGSGADLIVNMLAELFSQNGDT
jgi:arginase